MADGMMQNSQGTLSTPETENFSGPLFIVGLPRSGTKLLRELLNNHSQIGIPSIETEFLPYLHLNWNSFGDLSQYESFEAFYTQMLKLPYFWYLQREGEVIACRSWYDSCPNFSVSGVFEALIRHDANIPTESKRIWGDKSPSYVRHLLLLKNIYPTCRIIHITRDVRDYCLSIHKAWKKNMFRAAQRWSTDVTSAKEQGNRIGRDYLEIRYEDLIETPDVEMKKICQFLHIPFEADMVTLSRPSENIGDAANRLSIVKKNKGKWQTQLDPTRQTRIEEIACDTLRACGYEVGPEIKSRSIGVVTMVWYQLLDGINLLKSHKDSTFAESIRFYWKYFKISGNRIR